MEIEFQRNRERYQFMKWGMQAFEQFPGGAARRRHRAPGEPGIPGQGCAGTKESGGRVYFPRQLRGHRFSHTTMINGLGVAGWGVGGIEAEAGMLGQPVYLLIPEVVGVELTGKSPPASPPPTSC
jgi:aconitate hydratase